MYEKKHGFSRLANALDDIRENETVILRLASLLNYDPQQLREDIRALYDCYQEQKERAE